MSNTVTSTADSYHYQGPGASITSRQNMIRIVLINFVPLICYASGLYSTIIWFGEDYEYAIEQGYKPSDLEKTLDALGEMDIMFRVGVLSLVMTVVENVLLMTPIKTRRRIPL